jgi:hypothetical protein
VFSIHNPKSEILGCDNALAPVKVSPPQILAAVADRPLVHNSIALPSTSTRCQALPCQRHRDHVFLIHRRIFALSSSVSRCFGSRRAEHVCRCLQRHLSLHRCSWTVAELQAEGVPEPPPSPTSSSSRRLRPRLPALPPHGRDLQETLLRRSTSRAPCVLPGSNSDC